MILYATPLKADELHYAVSDGDRARVVRLLADGADVNDHTYDGFTPLHLAHDPAIVEILLRYKPDFNLRDSPLAQTPLEHAADEACHGDVDAEKWHAIVKLLLDAGAFYDIQSAIYLNDVNRVRELLKDDPTRANGTHGAQCVPLRVAAREGRYEICKLLLKSGAEPDDVEEGNGFSIVQEAVACPRIVKLLIGAGADLQRRITWMGGRTGAWPVGDEATVLHYAAWDGAPETVAMLIDSGVDIFATSHDTMNEGEKQTALEVAALFGRADNAVVMLNHPNFAHASPEYRKRLLEKCLLIGASPNPMAMNANRPKLVEALLKEGVGPNVTEGGASAVQIAVRQIHPGYADENEHMRNVAAVLLRYGATIDLFSAVAIGDEAQVSRLLKQDPTAVDARAADGLPALDIAVKMDYRNVVRQLLVAGCDLDIRNRCADEGDLGDTALHSAGFWGRYEIANQLLAAGANVDALSSANRTPLHEAARMSNVRVARLLLEHGARTDLRDNQGRTPPADCGWKNSHEMKRLFQEFDERRNAHEPTKTLQPSH